MDSRTSAMCTSNGSSARPSQAGAGRAERRLEHANIAAKPVEPLRSKAGRAAPQLKPVEPLRGMGRAVCDRGKAGLGSAASSHATSRRSLRGHRLGVDLQLDIVSIAQDHDARVGVQY